MVEKSTFTRNHRKRNRVTNSLRGSLHGTLNRYAEPCYASLPWKRAAVNRFRAPSDSLYTWRPDQAGFRRRERVFAFPAAIQSGLPLVLWRCGLMNGNSFSEIATSL